MKDNKQKTILSEIIYHNNNKETGIINKYQRGEYLGSGTFGECYEYKSEDDGKKYAVKIIKKNKFNENNENVINPKNKEIIKSKIDIQKSFKSSKIVKVNL